MSKKIIHHASVPFQSANHEWRIRNRTSTVEFQNIWVMYLSPNIYFLFELLQRTDSSRSVKPQLRISRTNQRRHTTIEFLHCHCLSSPLSLIHFCETTFAKLCVTVYYHFQRRDNEFVRDIARISRMIGTALDSLQAVLEDQFLGRT